MSQSVKHRNAKVTKLRGKEYTPEEEAAQWAAYRKKRKPLEARLPTFEGYGCDKEGSAAGFDAFCMEQYPYELDGEVFAPIVRQVYGVCHFVFQWETRLDPYILEEKYKAGESFKLPSYWLALGLDAEGRNRLYVNVVFRAKDLYGNFMVLPEVSLTAHWEGESYHGGFRPGEDCLNIADDAQPEFVSFQHGPREMVQRAAAVLDASLAEISSRLLPSSHCQACNRPLTDPVSRELLLGPTCAERLGLPHNSTRAAKVAKQRHEFYLKLDAEVAAVAYDR